MAERPVSRPQTGFQTAVEDLTDGLSRLVRQHFALARVEMREEIDDLKKQIGAILVFAVVALLGYLLLNLAIILLFGVWLDSLAAMATTALILAILHLGVGVTALVLLGSRLRENEVGLSQTTEELQRNKQWLKEIRNNSSRALPTES